MYDLRTGERASSVKCPSSAKPVRGVAMAGSRAAVAHDSTLHVHSLKPRHLQRRSPPKWSCGGSSVRLVGRACVVASTRGVAAYDLRHNGQPFIEWQLRQRMSCYPSTLRASPADVSVIVKHEVSHGATDVATFSWAAQSAVGFLGVGVSAFTSTPRAIAAAFTAYRHPSCAQLGHLPEGLYAIARSSPWTQKQFNRWANPWMDAERSLIQARRQEMKRAARHESRLASGEGHGDGDAEQGVVDDEAAEAEARAERALVIQRRQAAKKALQRSRKDNAKARQRERRR